VRGIARPPTHHSGPKVTRSSSNLKLLPVQRRGEKTMVEDSSSQHQARVEDKQLSHI